MVALVENLDSRLWTPDDLKHIQNSKLLTKLLFLVDSGARGIGTLTGPDGSLIGLVDYESYKSPSLEILKYRADSELNDAQQFKVWTPQDRKLVFHACQIGENEERTGLTFLWRHDRPHGRLAPSNVYWSHNGQRLPPTPEPQYKLETYIKGAWEEEVTKIAKGMLKENSNFFDVHYRSNRRFG